MISVCALVPYPLHTVPGQRYRIEQWRPYLGQEGISVELVPFADTRLLGLLYQPGRLAAKAAMMAAALVRRLAHVATVASYDAVFIYRAACPAGPAVLERAIALLPRPVLFDFDDAIHLLHTSAANQRFGWLKCPAKTATICRLSTHVIVGNAYLADYARQYNPRVSIIPSSIDLEHYQPTQKRATHGRIIVGWMGSSTSQTYLELFAPTLRRVARRRDVEIRVISDRKPTLPEVPFVWRPWSAETEVEELRHFDIGIMPMPDDQWARGKCALKALQYMAMGVPTVCSAVGTNREVIQHGENGLLATTPEDWLGHLQALIEHAQLRERLGSAGRKTVEASYSMRRCAALFARVVREVLEKRP